MTKNSELLTNVAGNMAPFSLDYTAGILRQYMQLFCITTRLFLLLRVYPSKLIVQMYSLVQGHASLRDKADRRAEMADRQDMVQLVASCDKPVTRLQEYFKLVTPRISQVCIATAQQPLQFGMSLTQSTRLTHTCIGRRHHM